MTTASNEMNSGASLDLLVIADWLPPDFGAVGQYALQQATDAARRGLHVCLLGLSTRPSQREVTFVGSGSLEIIRIRRKPYDKASVMQRALWTLSSNVLLSFRSIPLMRRARRIVFTGSPPYLVHFLAPFKFLTMGEMRYRIADFHPECLMATMNHRPWALQMLESLTWFWRRRVDVLEIVSEDQRPLLLRNGVSPYRIELRRDTSPVSFEGIAPAQVPANLMGKFVILYSGNWGVAHDAKTFLDALEQLAPIERSRIGLWLNAVGNRANEVEAKARELGIAVAHTAPCPLEHLGSILLAADLHLVTLADSFVGLVLPSKIYACIDSGRPILFIGSDQSDVHFLASEALGPDRYRRAGVGQSAEVVASIRSHLPGRT